MKRLPRPLFSLAALLLFSTPAIAKDKPSLQRVWVVVQPIQCLGNPWEKEWLGKHKNDVALYPKRKEFEIMRNYFKRNGVPIQELRLKAYYKGEPLAPACDSPRGDTVYLLINAENVPQMVSLGYTERLPAKDVPKKK